MTFTIDITTASPEPNPSITFRQLDDQGIEIISAGMAWGDMSEVRDLVASLNFYNAAIRMLLEGIQDPDDGQMKINFATLVGPHVLSIT